MGLFDIVGKVLGGNKSKSEQAPWDEAVPYLTDTMSAAGDLFDKGTLGGVNRNFGQLTNRGLSDLTDIGRRNQVTKGAISGLDGIMGGSGYSGQDVGVGAVAGPQSYGDIPQNFGIDAVRESVLDTALPEVAGMFGRGGLVNSTSAMAAAGDAIASRLAPYEFDQVNRNQQLGLNQFNTEQDRRLGFDVNERNIGLGQANINEDRRFDQYDRGTQQQLAGIGLAPSVNQMQYGDAQSLFGVGQIRDEQRDRNLEANKALRNVTAGANFFLPFGGLGGTGSQTGSALDTIGKVGQAATSAFTLCDRRLKRDITQVGTWRGVAIYTFRYLWDDVLRVGPMAQEVPDYARFKVGDFWAVDMRAI